ncbi:MAG: hypothetical protein HOW97_35755 [Catenulispora sp.]|nr:hypothetical protein [Catenulispora sp.]
MTPTAAPARPALTRTAARVLAAFFDGAPHIAGDQRFTRHQYADGAIDWDAVLSEPGWSTGQQLLIKLAAALTGHHQVPPDALGAHLTGRHSDLVLAMCRAARQ